ncbi:HET-domain-containing protein, partial [Zopfia rhizophila CBS 207.26]
LEDEPLSSCIRGRVIQDDPTSEQTLRRALNWVDECNTAHAHTRCSIGDAALPLRVLDVDYGSAPSRIRLYEPNGARGKYIALSHVWGDIRQFTTTRSNIATHLQGISFEALPKTFQDAVFLTRRLSIQYLWIDSLCICQDDGPDWERESAKMAQIYQNAYLTIAATGSKHDSHGLLANRSPPEYVDFSMTMKNGRHGEVHAFLLPLEDAAHASSYCSLREDPLSSRGWALQERFLASRILHFATKQMFFECYCHMLSEDGFRVQGRFNSIHEDVHPSQVKQEGSSLSTLKARQYRGPWLWYSLLYSYYPRNLSKSSDKLPALSGIARTFEEKTGDKYVAGLWRSQLIEGLIWQATGIQSGKMKAPPEYRAPSWSWASIDGPFGNLGLAKKDDGTDWIDIAIIIDCHVEPKGENPYGEVKSGWIQMKAPIEPLSRSEEK